MGKGRYIYIDENLDMKLRNINASSLISELLRNYFQMHGSIESLEAQLADLEVKNKYQIEEFEKKKEQIIAKLDEQGEITAINKEDAELEARKLTNEINQKMKASRAAVRMSLNNIFKKFMKRDLTEEEYDEFTRRHEESPMDNKFKFNDFIEEKLMNMKNIITNQNNNVIA